MESTKDQEKATDQGKKKTVYTDTEPEIMKSKRLEREAREAAEEMALMKAQIEELRAGTDTKSMAEKITTAAESFSQEQKNAVAQALGLAVAAPRRRRKERLTNEQVKQIAMTNPDAHAPDFVMAAPEWVMDEEKRRPGYKELWEDMWLDGKHQMMRPGMSDWEIEEVTKRTAPPEAIVAQPQLSEMSGAELI